MTREALIWRQRRSAVGAAERLFLHEVHIHRPPEKRRSRQSRVHPQVDEPQVGTVKPHLHTAKLHSV